MEIYAKISFISTISLFLSFIRDFYIYMVAQKSKSLPNDQKIVLHRIKA